MKKIRNILYIIALILIFFQAFSHIYTDETVYVRVGYYMANHLTPYVDFFEHHNLFYFLFYLPMFFLFPGVATQIVIRLVSIVFIFISAYLIYKIVDKNKLGNPDIATFFFLFGYTGLPINFLRNEFLAFFAILLYLYFKNPFVKGICVALLGSSSMFFVLVALLIFIYRSMLYRKNKKNLMKFILGNVAILAAFLLFIFQIPFKTVYFYLVTFNLIISDLLSFPWYEIVFFSVILSLPYLMAFIGIYKHIKKSIAKEALLIFIGITGIILISSISTGGIQKAKLPSYLPLLVVLSIFSDVFKDKIKAIALILILAIITLAIYTPTLYGVNFLTNQQTFDSCVEQSAIVQLVDSEDSKLFLVRMPNSFYWFMFGFLNKKNIDLNLKQFSDPLTLCGNRLEKSTFICTNEKINELKEYCNRSRYVNLITTLRDKIENNLNIKIRLAKKN